MLQICYKILTCNYQNFKCFTMNEVFYYIKTKNHQLSWWFLQQSDLQTVSLEPSFHLSFAAVAQSCVNCNCSFVLTGRIHVSVYIRGKIVPNNFGSPETNISSQGIFELLGRDFQDCVQNISKLSRCCHNFASLRNNAVVM